MAKYYLMSVSADGIYVTEYADKAKLESDLNEEGGYTPDTHTYLDRVPRGDPNYWTEHAPHETAVLIIKGEIVVPQVGVRI